MMSMRARAVRQIVAARCWRRTRRFPIRTRNLADEFDRPRRGSGALKFSDRTGSTPREVSAGVAAEAETLTSSSLVPSGWPEQSTMSRQRTRNPRSSIDSSVMQSRQGTRPRSNSDGDALDRPVFSGREALTWPFPETSGSPVWQAWRAARDADRSELEANGWAALGLRQVMEQAAPGRREKAQSAANPAKPQPGESSVLSDSREHRDHGHHADRLIFHFEAALVRRLKRASLETLGDVAIAHSSGRKWWAMAPGIGPRRAHEIAQRVRSLLKVSA